jgi:hypothetical protein
LPSSEISSFSDSEFRSISWCALPDGIIGNTFSCWSTTQSNITGPLYLIISRIASSNLSGLSALIPFAPYASANLTESVPEFGKLAEAYGAKGIRAESPDKLDEAIREMIKYNGPVIFDCVVDQHENVFPMIPSGKAHHEMLLNSESEKEEISEEGKGLL